MIFFIFRSVSSILRTRMSAKALNEPGWLIEGGCVRQSMSCRNMLENPFDKADTREQFVQSAFSICTKHFLTPTSSYYIKRSRNVICSASHSTYLILLIIFHNPIFYHMLSSIIYYTGFNVCYTICRPIYFWKIFPSGRISNCSFLPVLGCLKTSR